MKTRISLILRIVASGLLAYFIFRRLDLAALFDVVSGANLGWGTLGLLSIFLANILGAYKWKLLANPVFHTSVSFYLFFRSYLIGFFYAMFVPGGLFVGEVMKGWRGTRREEKKTQLILSVFADRLTGFLALGILLALTFYVSPALWHDQVARIGLAASFFISVAGFFIFFNKAIIQILFFVVRQFIRVIVKKRHDALERFKELFLHYHSQKKLVVFSVFLSCAVHALWALSVYFSAKALGVPVPFMYLLWIYLIIGILFFLPISYAGIGIREWVFVYFLSLVNIPSETALALSLLFFGLQVISAFAGGIFEFHTAFKKS